MCNASVMCHVTQFTCEWNVTTCTHACYTCSEIASRRYRSPTRLPRGTKFEARALEGVMLENLDHGVYKVLVDDNTGAPRILESRHVTF